MKKVKDYVRTIPDFPEEGIMFRDVTSVLQDADGLQLAIDELVKLNEKYYVDIAFEGGEAETLAIDGPIFKKRLKILKDRKEWHHDSGVYIIEDAVLEEK